MIREGFNIDQSDKVRFFIASRELPEIGEVKLDFAKREQDVQINNTHKFYLQRLALDLESPNIEEQQNDDIISEFFS